MKKKRLNIYSQVQLVIALALVATNLFYIVQFQASIDKLNVATTAYDKEYNILLEMGQYNNCNVQTKVGRGGIMLKNTSFNVNVDSREIALLEFSNASNSMSPAVSPLNHAIGFAPISEEDIHVCDVISYYDGRVNVFHRVLRIDKDEKGTYYTVKGDNNALPDDGKVRFGSVNYVMLAIIY